MSFFILYCTLLRSDSLLQILRFPGYFETPLFRTFFHFPCDFEMAGFNCTLIRNKLHQSELSNRGFWSQTIENSSNLRLFATLILYVAHLKNKKSHKGRGGHGHLRIPPLATPLAPLVAVLKSVDCIIQVSQIFVLIVFHSVFMLIIFFMCYQSDESAKSNRFN